MPKSSLLKDSSDVIYNWGAEVSYLFQEYKSKSKREILSNGKNIGGL